MSLIIKSSGSAEENPGDAPLEPGSPLKKHKPGAADQTHTNSDGTDVPSGSTATPRSNKWLMMMKAEYGSSSERSSPSGSSSTLSRKNQKQTHKNNTSFLFLTRHLTAALRTCFLKTRDTRLMRLRIPTGHADADAARTKTKSTIHTSLTSPTKKQARAYKPFFQSP